MAEKTDLAALRMQVETQRQRAALARRLERAVAYNDPAASSLRAYAEELEAELEKLETQAAVLKQGAMQTAQESELAQSIAAMKPRPDPEPVVLRFAFSGCRHSDIVPPNWCPKADRLLLRLGFGVWGLGDLAERGTPEFYRQQAVRLTALAALALTPKSRLELLEMAAVFQKLAEYAAANREHPAAATKTKSA